MFIVIFKMIAKQDPFDALSGVLLEPALRFETEVFPDVFCKSVVDLGMARYWLFLARYRVKVNIMPRPVTVQEATRLRELSDKLAALHTVISFT